MKNHTQNPENKRMIKRVFVLMAAVFTAIAVAVACALTLDFSPAVDVDNVGAGEVGQSTTYSNKTGDLTAAGTLKNGDVLNYSYKGSVVSVTLPRGTYTIEAYGAQGGSFTSVNDLGGYGGQAKAKMVLSGNTTLYIVVGSQPTSRTGGYNGGGQGGTGSSTQGMGGGGATHIAKATGTLSSVSSGNVVIVAGGGGGAGSNNSDTAHGGHGGGTSGGDDRYTGNGTHGSGGGGGKYNTGGVKGNRTGYSTVGTNGSYGAGGRGSSGGSQGGGGGGGGWYGGGGGDYGQGCPTGGGGGSGYINTAHATAVTESGFSGGMKTGVQSGNGLARITVVSVNQGPVSKNQTVTNTSAATYYRGTSRNIDIAASTIAKDDDYANTSGATINDVYYSNGSSSNYDTLPSANNGLYLNSACTTSASAYLSWTWVNNQTLRITEIKKYPRNGVDGCTQNGRLTLYVKMRDKFGTTTTRGVSTVLFYFVVNDRPITANTDAVTKKYTANGKEYEYRYGDSTSSNASLNYIGTAGSIYNPNHKENAKVKTVFLPKPIAPTDTSGYTIYAKDIFGDGDTAYDKVGFRTVTAQSAYTQYNNYFTISYNADSSYASGIVPSITIKPSNIRPNGAVYVCATITAQTSETASKAAIGSQNTAVQLVFRLANTRPYFASSSAIDTGLNEPYIELDPNDPNGRTKTLNIANMIKDIDDSTLGAYFAQGANDLKIPVNEYIQVDSSNVVVPLKNNVGSNYAGKTQVASNSATTGEGTTPTGFAQGVIAAAGSSGAASAAVTYSYDSNKVIRFTARAATQYMYSSQGRVGDFYIMVRVVDPSDATDAGIWYPIAIKVISSAPTETPTVANFNLSFDGFTAGSPVTTDGAGQDAQQDKPSSIVITPVSFVDANGKVNGVGTTGFDFNKDSGHAEPFTVDPDTFVYSGEGVMQTRPLNDVVMLDGTTLNSVVKLYDTSDFFDVDLISLHANRNVFSKLNMTTEQLAAFGVRAYTGDASSDVGYEFYGLRITPKRSTNGEFFQFDVNVKDSHGTKGTVRVLVNIENRAVQARRGSYTDRTGTVSIDTAYPINTTGSGEYVYNRSIGAIAVNYKIERNDVVQITPYDLAYDLDIDQNNSVINNNGTFNSNPADSGFAAFDAFINKTYNIPHTSSASNPATAPSSVKRQALTFTNVENFAANAAQYSGYIDASVRTTCVSGNNEYAVPCIRIVGLSRTTSAVVQLRFTVSDGFSSLDFVVTVTVNNSKPMLNTIENHPKESESDFRISEPYTMTAEIGGLYNNAYQFTARQIAYDKDGDTPTFIAGSARVVAYDKNTGSYFDKLDASFNGVAEGNAAYNLSDYVQATFTKNGMGEDVVYVRALSSTEIFPLPIYLEVRVQDGFRAQPETETLHVLINVVNTAPKFVPDSLMQFRENDYSWQISYENKSETRIPRYIFNSKELHDSALVEGVNAAAANKTWLFDDADAMQNTMLNPQAWSTEGNNPVEKLVKQAPTSEENDFKVAENAFTTGDGVNAAIIYTATYPDEKSSENQYLNIEVLFFRREVDPNTGEVSFKNIPYADPAIKTAQYWALRITDKGNSQATATDTNIAIAIKDDHHGATVYSADKSTSKTGASDVTVFNLYYSYKTPGLTAMHTYYRTDGNAEAAEIIGGTETDPVYALQLDGFSSDRTYQFVGTLPEDQNGLKAATFADNFKYQYFVKTITRTGEDNKTSVDVTFKYYPGSSRAFYYDPIQVGADGLNKTIIPMSYLAMPKASDGGTEGAGNLHVTFANAVSGDIYQDGAKLLDKDYMLWGKSENIVFENLVLSDSDGNSWTGEELNDNPYIAIHYICDSNVLASEKVNKNRFVLEAMAGTSKFEPKFINSIESSGSSIYREDKYGFTFEKKSGGKRSQNNLKLTLALKTTAYVNNAIQQSAIEYVDVDIVLANSRPTVSYNGVDLIGYINNLDVRMTTSDTSGKVVALNDKNNTNPVGDYKLLYTDPDSTDTMRFMLASATGDMTKAEHKYITYVSNFRRSPGAFELYYGVSETAGSYEIDGRTVTLDEYKELYEPNPGYDKFFDVSPNDGTSSTLQFVPKAKTQLSIPVGTSAEKRKEILDGYNLAEDGNGIYYPFRILFYDDVNGSPITEGSWGTALIKVYIANDGMTVNRSVVTENYRGNAATAAYRGLPNYRFKLSKGTDFFVDASSLLIDNDIKLDGSSFAVDGDGWNEEEVLLGDYLVMPESYTRVNPTGEGALPITVGKPDENSGMSASTLCFKATSAFGGSIDLLYTFEDSVSVVTTGNKRAENANDIVKIIFSIEYNNEKPTANNITFAGSESLNIVMKTGDSFTLYAADSNLFNDDINGGFGSYTSDGKGYVQGNNPFVTGFTKDLYDDFVFNSDGYDFEADGRQKGDLGSLVVGSDDAPSTLRFGRWDKFSDQNDANMFEITAGTRYQCETGSNRLPMSVTVKALGVTDTVYTLTLTDSNQETTEININIKVLPTAPTVTDGLLPKGLTRVENSQNTFAMSLEYGESKEFELSSFMTDVDAGDVNLLEVYRNIDNTKYSVTNPQGISAVTVEDTKVLNSNAIKITATDFVPKAGEVVSVQFRVADAHGAVSDFITINVTIMPKDVSVVATQLNEYAVTLKSFADYERDGQPEYFNLVDLAGDAKLFADADVLAPSARYDVNIYALLKKSEKGQFLPIRYNSEDFDEEECKVLTLSDSRLTAGQSEIADYVSRFFIVSLSTDGKTLEFTPNSATISSETNNAKLDAIKLVITVAKRYSKDGKPTMDEKTGFMGVSVGNSALVAVQSSPVNSGYPLVKVGEDEERLRESAFLEFSGSAGDSLTWDLYNTKDRELGLFYDYDLINNPEVKQDGVDVGGLETITYVRAEFRGISETVSGKGDVLSVIPSGDGKSLTVKINRKVFTGQPPKDGNSKSYTDVSVDIYCADTIGRRSGTANVNNLVKTTITVRVENDVPEIKEVTDSATVSRLGYSVTYSDLEGYVLDAKIERGSRLILNIPDFIKDADIDMDEYVLLYTGSDNSLVTSSGELMGSTGIDGTSDGIGRIKSGNNTLFTVRLGTSSNSYSVSTLNQIIFTCESALRGAVGTCQIKFRDSVKGAETHVLTVNITVDNIAPTLKSGVSTDITLMGVGKDGTNEDAIKASKVFNILDFIADANGDNYVATDPEYEEKLPTYVFVDAILVYDINDPINKPDLYGPNLKVINEETGEEEYSTPTLCRIDWSELDMKHQSFGITPIAGVYGVQKIMLTIVDSGYEDGSSAGVLDGKSFDLTLTVTVANPLEDVADTLDTKQIAYGVTKTVTIEDLLGADNSKGYEIASIEETGSSSLGIFKPGEAMTYTSAVGGDNIDEWRIYARTEGAKVNTTVTFKAGDVTRVRTLPIEVVVNNPPEYKNDGTGEKRSYEYNVNMLTDSVTRTLKIYPEDWFTDTDDGDVMTFVSPIVSSQSVMVEAILDYDTAENGGRAYLLLKFNRRGESEISFNVSDSSGRLYDRKITVNCTDAPELSWWENIVSLIEANWMWFWIIVGCSLLFIILLIIIIVVVHKKRKMRREIEALLNAETELEEEMMRLGAGGSTPYQSFGYLPPTQTTVGDPGLMLGGSANNPAPNSLQLNAGTGAPNGQPPQNSTPGSIPPPANNNDGFNPDDF